MSTRSPRDAPAGTIRELGLPERAVTALTRAGVTTAAELASLTRGDLSRIPGLGPGTIAAIRLAVAEPPSSDPPAAGPGRRAVPGTGSEPARDASTAVPSIPSFDSLRNTRRRTAVDLLVPGPAAAPAASPPDLPGPPGSDGPESTGRPDSAGRPDAADGPPRPAEYADLLRLGARVAYAAATAPGRVALWWMTESARCLSRLLGDGAGSQTAPGGGGNPGTQPG